MRPSRELERLSEALSDHARVDWEAESRREPALKGAIERLRQIEALRTAHQAIADAARSGDDSGTFLFDWGPLRIIERVGEGAFGEVYRALDTRLERHVALKLRRADSTPGEVSPRRFLEEARSLARVRHSNVLVVHGADVHDGRPGFWTDYIHGKTLAKLLDEAGPLVVDDAARIGVALCRALAAVHRAGFIHGDVKASNVMREEGGRILLMDFGAVSRRAPAGEDALASDPAFGTPLVLAPEVLRGDTPQPTSDLYSVGVLLHQLVTGALPIAAESWTELLRHQESRPPLAFREGDGVTGSERADLPESFVRVLQRALAFEPPARYGSATEMEQALLDVTSGPGRWRDGDQMLRSLLEELVQIPEEMRRRIGREAARSLIRIHDSGQCAVLFLDRMLMRADGTIELATADAGPEVPHPTPATMVEADLRAFGQALLELAPGEARRHAEPGGERFMDVLTHTLLGHLPEAPICTARELLEILTEGEKSPWWRETERAMRRAARARVRRMGIPRETRLQGRRNELAALRAAYDRARAGEGRVVLLEGEAGMGKSRVVDELIEDLSRHGENLNFLFGSYPPGGGATAAGAFLAAYRDHLLEEPRDETLQDHLAAAPGLIPAFTHLLRGESVAAETDPLTPDSLQTAFVHIARALARERPTVILIDDLHFAPHEGRSLFAALASAIRGDRVLLIGSSRPGLAVNWVAQVLRQEHVVSISLPRLTDDDILRILGDALQLESVPEELASNLALRCDGNPLFLLENLHALQEAGIVVREAGGPWRVSVAPRSLPLPRSIECLIQARFSALAEEDRELLDVACCAGFEFDPALVADALGRETLPVLRRFAVLEKEHGVVRATGRRYVFHHHQAQEALYSGLFEPLREHYHGRLAAALEEREGALAREAANLEGHVAVALSEHYFRGPRPEDGARYLNAALRHLNETFRLDAWLNLADGALRVPGLLAGETRLTLLGEKIHKLVLVGRHENEAAALEEIHRLAREIDRPREHAEALRLQADYESRIGHVREAREHLERAARLADKGGDPVLMTRIAQQDGNLLRAMNRHEEALASFTRSIEFARRAGNRRMEVQGIGALGTVYHMMGEAGEAERLYDEHIRLCGEIGDRAGEAIGVGNLGALFVDTERYAASRPLIERHLALSRELGLRSGEMLARANLGLLHSALGHSREALPYHQDYVRLAREIGYRADEALALEYYGVTLCMLGRHEEARAHFDGCLDLSRQIQDRVLEGKARIGLARIAEQTGDPVLAERDYREARRLLEAFPSEAGFVETFLCLGRLARVLGRTDEALEELGQARKGSRALSSRTIEVLACAHLALVSGGCTASEASSILDANEARLSHAAKLEARFLLFQATGDATHREAAKVLLDELREAAPETDRGALTSRVPLYREISMAVESASERLRSRVLREGLPL